jgi:hypothetical protein
MSPRISLRARSEARPGGVNGPPGTIDTVSETFALAPVPGVLSERVLGVSVAELRNGVNAVRTDGEAVWLTPRPSWERIPTAVSRVTFTASGQTSDGRHGPVSTPRVLTGSRAHRLAAFINSAEVVQLGASSCADAAADSVKLTFFAADGRIVARALETPTGCASITLTVGRRTAPELSDYPSVTDELVRLGAVPTCAGDKVTASASLPARNGPTSTLQVNFDFMNSSEVMCRVSGFPHLTLLDAAGHRLPTSITKLGRSIVQEQGLPAASVYDPGQSAAFGVTYTPCAGAPVAVRAQVSLPRIRHHFSLHVGDHRRPFAPCHGSIDVGNI